MKYLIDTHIFIWMIGLSYKIPKNIIGILKDSQNDISVSLASIWEISIKTSIGKLSLPFELAEIFGEIEKLNISILNISLDHLIKVADFPFHHKDPFDRLIISQAIIEGLPVISSDKQFKLYEIECIW